LEAVGNAVEIDVSTAWSVANAEFVPSAFADEDGEADRGSRGITVGYRTAFRHMHMPAQGVVIGQLRMDGVLDEQRVEHVGRVLLVARDRGREDGPEIAAELTHEPEIAGCDAPEKVRTDGEQLPEGVQVTQGVLAGILRVDELDHQIRVRGEVHVSLLAEYRY